MALVEHVRLGQDGVVSGALTSSDSTRGAEQHGRRGAGAATADDQNRYAGGRHPVLRSARWQPS
jgi:hypothetical protein